MKKIHPIYTMSFPTESQIKRNMAASGVWSDKMSDFFPVHIKSTKDPEHVIGLIMIDWKAKVKDMQLLKAVLNGSEVEVKQGEGSTDQT